VAKFAATDVYVLVTPIGVGGGAQNISDWCVSVDTPDAKTQIDVSGFNPTSSKEFVPGTRDQSIVLGILQDFGATQIHALFNPLYTNSTQLFTIELRPTSASRSATNPWFGGTAQLYEYDGLNAQLNNRAEITATILPSSGTIWAWATS
jgi:hypothetical protein